MKNSMFAFFLICLIFVSNIFLENCKASDLNEVELWGNEESYYTIANFKTKFIDGNENRTKNIKLALGLINNVILYPGETFSYNETIGPTSQERGFLPARTFVKGRETKGYGGGVCQVSSTLYNAAEQAGLTIVERHSHSRKVSYIERGKDAAASYGGIDLKFRNDYDYPIIIEAGLSEKNVEVSIIAACVEGIE